MGLEAPWDDDDFETSAQEVGALLRAQAEAEDDTEEEGEFSFSSLSCFRPRTTKKKPVLVVDEEELAKEHEQLMAGTVQLMEEEEEHPRAASSFLGLNPMDEDGLLEEEGEEADQGDLPGFSDPDSLLRPEDNPEHVAKPGKKKMALEPLAPEDLAEAQAALDAAKEAEEEQAPVIEESIENSDEPQDLSEAEEVPVAAEETQSPEESSDEAETEAGEAADNAWFNRVQDGFVPPPLIDSDLPGPQLPGKDELAEIAARLFGSVREAGAEEQAEPSAVPVPPVELVPEPKAEPEPEPAPAIASEPEPEAMPVDRPGAESEEHPDAIPPAEPEPILDAEPEGLPTPIEDVATPGFSAFDEGDEWSQPAEAAPEFSSEEDDAGHSHVMREYDYEEEEAANMPDYDYAPAVTEQSKLRARLLKSQEALEEPRGESLFAKFWNWLSGLFG